MKTRLPRIALNSALNSALSFALNFAPSVFAGTSHWTHTTESDFKNGNFENVVATNLGDLKLSRAVKTLLEQDPRVSSVYAMAEAKDGTIYAATGPHGIVLQLKGEKVTTLTTLEDENIFSLLVEPDGRLLVGTGGERGRIVRVDPANSAQSAEIFSADGVQYIWKTVRTADGMLYAATGPHGQLYEIKPDGSRSILFDSDENNLVSLLDDGTHTLYAGSDPNGLVYRIDRRTREVFVMYDAPESEITALALDAKGNLFAATGQAPEGEETAGSSEMPAAAPRGGRPEASEIVNPLPSPVPNDPKPPVPDPNPNEPDPIPKKRQSFFAMDPAIERALADDQPEDPEPPDPVPAPNPGPHPGPGPTPGPGPGPGPRPRRPAARNPQSRPPMMPGSAFPPSPTEGNAIYRIDRGGFVTEVFRQPVMVLSLIERDGTLLVGTGSEGLIYEVNPEADETLVLAKVESKQVTSLLPTRNGSIILGLSNVGALASMSSGFAAKGSYSSPVLDAGQISRFGKMHIRGSLPPGSTLTVATRSGNLQEPSEAGWSKWSDEVAATEFLQIPSKSARFLQYRLTLTSDAGRNTPVVDEIDVAHRVPNLPPRVQSIQITAAPDENNSRPASQVMSSPGVQAAPAARSLAGRMRVISWEVADPNSDTLEFSLHFRSGVRGPWILLDEKLKEPTFQWDTRGVADGRYQVRITASDVKANPLGEGREGQRVSDPVIVDNTAPVIGDLQVVQELGKVAIQAKAVDRVSTVTGVEYSINSKDDWQSVAASDNIYDSPEEGVSFNLDGLKAGLHQVMLRATDGHGNQSHETITVTIDAAP